MEIPLLGKEVVEGLYAAAAFEVPYEDTAKGKVKDWLANYKKAFNTDANTQAVIGYNAMMTFAHYAKLAGKDLTGQKLLDALESGNAVRRHLRQPDDEVLQDQSPRVDRDAGAEGREGPLGRGQGRLDVLTRFSDKQSGRMPGPGPGFFL